MIEVIEVDTFRTIRDLGMDKHIWQGTYDEEHVKMFLESVQKLVDRFPKAKRVHIKGLFPPEVALPLGAMMGMRGLNISYSRPTGYCIDLVMPQPPCPELDFA